MADTVDAPAAGPEMKTINVAKPFSVIINGAPFSVAAGVQKVPAEVADHWYTQAHLVQGGFGTSEYAKACRDAADAAFVAASAAIKKYEGLETAAQDAEKAAGLDPVEPAVYRLSPRPEGVAFALPPESGEDGPEVDGVGTADTTSGPDGNDTVAGEAGDDTIGAGAGEDILDGDTVADTASDVIQGEAGADAVPPAAADDAYPGLSEAQEKALDRDGDGKPGGAPAGGNKRKGGL